MDQTTKTELVIKENKMAFRDRYISLLEYYSNGLQLWYYDSDDTIEQIEVENYFNFSLFHNGDLIIINTPDGTAIRSIIKLENSIKVKKLK